MTNSELVYMSTGYTLRRKTLWVTKHSECYFKVCINSGKQRSKTHWSLAGWLVVLGFNATSTAKVISWQSVFPGFLTPVQTQVSLQSHRLLFSHASAEVRGENTPERNFASTGSRTHNHQVMCLISSPLSHPGRAWSSVLN